MQQDLFKQTKLEKLRNKWNNLLQLVDYRYSIWAGFIEPDGTPLKCRNCAHEEFDEDYSYVNEGCIGEIEVTCQKCGKVVAYWAYGYWQV